MNRKKKKKFMEKINCSFITPKKKKKKIRRINVYYILIFFLGEKRAGVYFKLKYLLPYLHFFLLYLKTFLVNRNEH